jgi:hypothetical protein
VNRRLIILSICGALAVTFALVFKFRKDSDSGTIGEDSAQLIVSNKPPESIHADERPGHVIESAERIRNTVARQNVIKKMNAPVKFYAQVVDQNGAPVQNAVLSGSVSSYNDSLLPTQETVQETKFEIRSDAGGQFELSGIRGWSLRIDKLEKDGYFWQHPGFGSFGVGGGIPSRGPTYSTPTQPFPMYVWKKGLTEPIIKHALQIRPFKQDALAVNLVTGQRVSTNEFSDLVFRFPRVDDPARAARAHRMMIVEIPDGGILETTDAHPYAAKPGDYPPNWHWLFLAADTPPGKEDWTRNFYVRARRGRVYAGLKITFDLPTLTIEAIANPAGSPILEPDPLKEITNPEEIRRLDEATRAR